MLLQVIYLPMLGSGMRVPLDDLVAEIDSMIPGNGIVRIYERTKAPSESAEHALAAFIIAMVRDLWDEGSTKVENMKRLATAVGFAVYELEKLEERLEKAAQDLDSSRNLPRSAKKA